MLDTTDEKQIEKLFNNKAILTPVTTYIKNNNSLDTFFSMPYLNKRKTDMEISNQFFEFHYYSEEFFNAGKFLAIQRVKYEIELLYAYNNKILQNNWVVNHDNYSTDHILKTLDKIINK